MITDYIGHCQTLQAAMEIILKIYSKPTQQYNLLFYIRGLPSRGRYKLFPARTSWYFVVKIAVLKVQIFSLIPWSQLPMHPVVKETGNTWTRNNNKKCRWWLSLRGIYRHTPIATPVTYRSMPLTIQAHLSTGLTACILRTYLLCLCFSCSSLPL